MRNDNSKKASSSKGEKSSNGDENLPPNGGAAYEKVKAHTYTDVHVCCHKIVIEKRLLLFRCGDAENCCV